MRIEFSDCRDEHLPDLDGFLARTYRQDFILRVNEDFLRWQFKNFYDSSDEGIRLKLALYEGKVAGCLGYVPALISISGRVVNGAWVMNWMVEEALRKLGLGPMLMREVSKEFDALLDVGANADARSVLTRMGWADFGRVPRYIKVFDVTATASLTESGSLEWPASTEVDGLEAKGAVQQVQEFGDSADDLWDRVWGQAECGGTRRSSKFLNWRYVRHPVFTYRLFEIRDRDRLAGIGVYRIEQVRDMPVTLARMTEFICESDLEGALLKALMEDAVGQGAAAIDFFCTGKRSGSVLARAGFLADDHPATSAIPRVFQPIDRTRAGFSFLASLGKTAEASGVQDWYVTSGDGDMDRPN